MARIYLHEQDNAFREVLTYCLTQEGWDVTTFKQGAQALLHSADHPDIWIVDADDEEGFKVIRHIKTQLGNVSIIATSERERVINRVVGFELGCDDFVVKPFLPRELILRIRRIIERSNQRIWGGCSMSSLMLQDYCVDLQRRIVTIDGAVVSLTSKEFELLLFFMQHRGIALSRDQIIRSVWGENYFGSDRAVDDLIRRVRKKVKYLKVETLYGYGYLVAS
jgi:two-component system, OmpR family, response regulator CssR